MAGEKENGAGQVQVDALIDELIHDIFKDSGGSYDVRGMATTAALFETAFGSPRGGSRVSVLERLVLAEAFANEMAEALAPVLADQLAPRLMKALEQMTAKEAEARQPASAGSASQARKPEAK